MGGESALRVKLFGSLDRSRGVAPDFLPEAHGGTIREGPHSWAAPTERFTYNLTLPTTTGPKLAP